MSSMKFSCFEFIIDIHLTNKSVFSFMENLQTEVLELEFNEFAKGMPTITEEEFAYILLRYTILSKDDHCEYIDRLKQRIPHSKV